MTEQRTFPARDRRGAACTLLVIAALLLPGLAGRARADWGDADADSVYLIGEFVDPVCIFQHGMQGTLQRQCALVRGRVDQGMWFLDVRHRRLYTVIGQTHWQDPRRGFLESLGDTFAVRGKVWRRDGGAAIDITAAYPYRQQPPARVTWWPWRWAWSVLAGCALLGALYAWALLLRARERPGGEPIEIWRAISFAAGLLIVVVALEGPIHDLSDYYLFSTHMVQHLLLAQLFPPLVLVGLPLWLKRWLLAPRPVAAVWRAAARVPVGFALYTIVLCLWHFPTFYEWMMRDHGVHIVMHLTLMGTALLMWWPVVGAEAAENPLSPPGQMLYLFLLGTPMMAVAALITFADHPLYPWYALAPRFMGMPALDDQRLGGLIMWVTGGLYYWGAMSVVYFRWAARESRSDDPFLIRDAV